MINATDEWLGCRIGNRLTWISTIKLQNIIYKHNLSSVLIPVASFGFLLLAFYFWGTAYLNQKSQQVLVEEVTSTLAAFAKREAKLIDEEFNSISRLSLMMQKDHQKFFNDDLCFFPFGEPLFEVHENGALFKVNNNGGSSLYFSSSTRITEDEMKKAKCSEVMDSLLKQIVDSNPLVVQAYINTWDDMNRLYPFMTDAPMQYGPVLQMEDFNFYYLADAQHNPSRETAWTEAYLDPAGQGWMISNVVPVYRQDGFLEGVSGLDITLEILIAELMTTHLPWESGIVLTGKSGNIIAMSEWTEQQFDFVVSNSDSLLTPNDRFNAEDSPYKVYEGVVETLSSVNGISTADIGGSSYLVSREIVSATGWNLYSIVDRSQLLKPIREVSEFNTQVGWVMVFLALGMFSILIVYLQVRARSISWRVAQPMAELSQQTTLLGSTLNIKRLGHVGIDEIDRLNDNFNELGDQLSEKTRELVDSITREKERMKEALEFEKLAVTDPLTGLFNRLKLEEVAEKEVDRCRRSGEAFGVILIDIDHFKRVNDTYGHQVGDEVLIEVGRLIKNNVRQLDTAGRWGGEEFIVICPLSDLDGIYEISNVLRSGIASNRFPLPDGLTISAGIACYIADESWQDLVERADKALYEAKNSGRNRVVKGIPNLRAEDGAFL